MSGKRPFSVTVLIFGVLINAVFYINRFYQTFKQWGFLTKLPLAISPVYFILTGLLFGVAGLLVTWGLWVGRSWAPKATKVYVLAVAIYYWVDRLLIVNSEISRESWLLSVIGTIFILGLPFLVLMRLRSRSYFERDVFGEVHDRT